MLTLGFTESIVETEIEKENEAPARAFLEILVGPTPPPSVVTPDEK